MSETSHTSEIVENLTSEIFEEEVTNNEGITIVDFWAPWCGPCKMVGPILKQIAEENSNVKVCKVNTDENPSLATKFGIRSIPTIIYFKDGKQYDTIVGAVPKEDILAKIK